MTEETTELKMRQNVYVCVNCKFVTYTQSMSDILTPEVIICQWCEDAAMSTRFAMDGKIPQKMIEFEFVLIENESGTKELQMKVIRDLKKEGAFVVNNIRNHGAAQWKPHSARKLARIERNAAYNARITENRKRASTG